MLHPHRTRLNSLPELRVLQPQYRLLSLNPHAGKSQHLAEPCHEDRGRQVYLWGLLAKCQDDRACSQERAVDLRRGGACEGLWVRFLDIGDGEYWRVLFLETWGWENRRV